MYQLIIQNGRVLDPANDFDQVADVAIENGRVVGVGRFDGAAALQTVDATGCLVTPGLIDHHCHLYPLAAIGLPAEAVCFASGVTTAVDAGSTGCDTFGDYDGFLTTSKLRIRAYLNVCSIGLASLPHRMEDVDPAHFDEAAVRDTFDQYGDRLLGLKLRTSREIVGELGYGPLKATVALADKLGVPVMVHCTNRPAEDMGLGGEIGCLTPGACGDVAVFRQESSLIPFGDRPYGDPDQALRPASWRLRTMLTVRNGEMVYRDQMI